MTEPKMSELEPAWDALVRRTLTTPAAGRLKLSLIAASQAEVSISLPFSPDNRTEGDIVHGGVIATLIDIAGVAAAVAASRRLPEAGATSSLCINYLCAAVACDLTAHALLLRAGRQNVVRVTVSAPAKMIAEGHVTVVLH